MAEKFIKHTGLVVPLDAANVDTDAIIPKQFLQKVTRTGFGAHLFNDWRFLDEKGQQPNPDFVLNFPQYQGASRSTSKWIPGLAFTSANSSSTSASLNFTGSSWLLKLLP